MSNTSDSCHLRDEKRSAATVRFLGSLADPTRLAILDLLENLGELCVCELVAALGSTQPKVSRHLAWLRRAGLVADRRTGTWVYYRLDPSLNPRQRSILRILAKEPDNHLFRKMAKSRLQSFQDECRKQVRESHSRGGSKSP